jgi:hypothetical protein
LSLRHSASIAGRLAACERGEGEIVGG